jgi:cytochrome P450
MTVREGGAVTVDYSSVDIFSDASLVEDPYPYYEFVRALGPVWREPRHGMFVVTGYDEAAEIYRDPDIFSSCNSFSGPFHNLPEPEQSDDLTAQIERHRDAFAFHDNLITFDPPAHTAHRGLMMRLLTPKRLQENEAFMLRLADEQIDRFAYRGKCDFVAEYAQPFSLLAIADLLGVPEEDRPLLRERIIANGPAGSLGQPPPVNLLAYLEEFFIPYIEERRDHPREDVLTQMALALFPDNSTPQVIDVVRAAAILFAGGQGTSARFQSGAVQRLAAVPQIQEELRRDPTHIPDFVEEMLRLESPSKVSFRMARKSTTLAGVPIPAGSTILVLLGAADRDPERFECPAEFRLGRSNVRQHMAFGRGVHSCPGGPLVRAEAIITIERLLARLDDITISVAEHGSPTARRWTYIPSYILRGVQALHLEFTPRSGT